jgi:hypothetical protein
MLLLGSFNDKGNAITNSRLVSINPYTPEVGKNFLVVR